MPDPLPKDHDYIELFDIDDDTSETDDDSDPELSSLRPKQHLLDGGLPSSSSSVSLPSSGIYLNDNTSRKLSSASVPLFHHQSFDIEGAAFGEKAGEPEIGDAKSLALQVIVWEIDITTVGWEGHRRTMINEVQMDLSHLGISTMSDLVGSMW